MKKNIKPKLPDEELKKRLTVRFSDREKAILEEKAKVYSGGNVSKYIRSRTLENHTTDIKKSESSLSKNDIFAMLREVNKQGTNLNQLTKFFNSGVHKTGELYMLLKDIKKTNSEISKSLINLLGSD
ncbi:plasmid mobilization protein [Elizabethkingia ursingii]